MNIVISCHTWRWTFMTCMPYKSTHNALWLTSISTCSLRPCLYGIKWIFFCVCNSLLVYVRQQVRHSLRFYAAVHEAAARRVWTPRGSICHVYAGMGGAHWTTHLLLRLPHTHTCHQFLLFASFPHLLLLKAGAPPSDSLGSTPQHGLCSDSFFQSNFWFVPFSFFAIVSLEPTEED